MKFWGIFLPNAWSWRALNILLSVARRWLQPRIISSYVVHSPWFLWYILYCTELPGGGSITYLVSSCISSWWFQAISKILVKWESSPIFGVKITNIWNHHLAYWVFLEYLLSPSIQAPAAVCRRRRYFFHRAKDPKSHGTSWAEGGKYFVPCVFGTPMVDRTKGIYL